MKKFGKESVKAFVHVMEIVAITLLYAVIYELTPYSLEYEIAIHMGFATYYLDLIQVIGMSLMLAAWRCVKILLRKLWLAHKDEIIDKILQIVHRKREVLLLESGF